ncbi:MAG: glutamate--tRNA ligase [Kofleriaceae bacterium]|jgi:glutamyl-tRNA synthetase|nr:glutamate--tRNA ligase [Kofleriaceae bacterium]MBP6841938.1 glutamate--tRNA ligase [Kofleriaceae bacterium]MBP9204239.1 glutamate--tRNA ligase [Kofleriaceae bacterium]
MTASAPTRPVRVRIAPSPTGDPHVGTAYIALFNYVFARQQGGKFILRIEDTDQTRARADSEQMIFDALRWTGLSWDEGPDVGGPFGPYRQSERAAIYREHTAQLLARGKAYRCFCTADRLAQLRVQQAAAKQTHGYDRRCRTLDAAESTRRAEAGEAHVVRLAAPTEGEVVVRDRLRGDVHIGVDQVDDQVLLKSDGLPTYHLANVVDDHLMEITHVIRAEEWISSTPKHVLLYAAFGWDEPVWMHMPLLRNSDKSKISKRKNPVSINYYRDAGILPHALLNFLALMGWSFGGDREKFTLAEMIEHFSWDRISLGGPVFDLEKLVWLNEKYIHDLSYEQLADTLFAWRLARTQWLRVLPLVRERIKKLDEIIPATEYFFSGDLDYAGVLADMVVPDVAPADVGKGLLAYVERFEAREGFDAKVLEEEARAWCEAQGWKSKHAFMLLRLASTGRKASPPLFDTMAVIGKEMTRRRLRRAAELIAARKAP